jgi:glycosyltransferase involved in cell wall biosynthesis
MPKTNLTRILYLDPSGKMWGSERSLLLLLQALDSRQIKAAVCLPRRSLLLDALKPLGLPLFAWLPEKFRSGSRWSQAHAMAGLLGAVLISRAQIIHLNQAGFVRAAAWVARLLGISMVVHVRLTADAGLIGRRVGSWRRTVCIANSKFVADELKARGVPAERIVQITNPIELASPGMPKEPRRWQAGFVGRLSRDKGIELFLQACQQVVQARPSARAVVVGSSGGKTADGRDYLAAMKDLAGRLGIADRVEFLGFRKDVPELMRQMEVFVMASEAEPWGRVVAEAMVAGAAVVATNAGGPCEMIEHGVSGLLVPPGNAAEMTSAIRRLLENPEFAHKLAISGRQWVARECDPRMHATKVAQVYQALLAEDES